jgi:hypothetical protein
LQDLRRKEVRCGLTSSDGATRAACSVKSLPGRKQERCASCGKFRGLSLYPPNSTDNAYPFCGECIRRLKEGERLFLIFTSEFEPPGSPEEGFWWLFKAARVLLREGVSNEDHILPTLVFYHEIDRGAAGGRAATSYGGTDLMPHVWYTVKTVDGIDILEEQPLRADILVKRQPPDKGARQFAKEFSFKCPFIRR